MARVAQLGGSPRALLLFALPIATLACASGHGSTTADGATPDSTHPVDAAPADVTHVTADASVDATTPDAGCAISNGAVPALDGNNDIAKYTAAQQLAPGAMIGSDAAALAWDRENLYVTVSSIAFGSAYEPLHVYVETGMTLGTAAAAHGKEYSGLTPALPFTPTQVIAVRRISNAGTGGYDGVFVPTDQWQARTIDLDSATYAASTQLSVRVPWSALGGCPTQMRLALHVVHGVAGNEWKDLVPSTHTPWVMPGGGYYEIDLTGAAAVASFTLR
ncbi:MAG TPA: hypothetical protein VFV99_27325 [Kofleriaceae bacterium]|nr:hypothetical protein [Kofleriaceae bacterium]